MLDKKRILETVVNTFKYTHQNVHFYQSCRLKGLLLFTDLSEFKYSSSEKLLLMENFEILKTKCENTQIRLRKNRNHSEHIFGIFLKKLLTRRIDS